MPDKYQDEANRDALQRLSVVLRRFGVPDRYGLSDLVRVEACPTASRVEQAIRASNADLPPTITVEYLARVIATDLVGPTPETCDWNERYPRLSEGLGKIPAGRPSAARYHQVIFDILAGVFDAILADPVKEQEINEGRGRIDIKFRNPATDGFFGALQATWQIPAGYVFFECKNYSNALSNPEFDQLSGRLNKRRGMFGVIVCRKIENRSQAVSHCRDRRAEKDEYIIVLDDDDVTALVAARRNGDIPALDRILDQRFEELVL